MEEQKNTNKKRILIISYDMIPTATTWGGCQRMYFLAEDLVRNNYDVTIFSCKKNKNNYYGNDVNFKNISIPIKNRVISKLFSPAKEVESLREEVDNSKKQSQQSLSARLRNFIKSNKRLYNILYSVDRYIFNESTFLVSIACRVWCKETRKKIFDYTLKNNIENIIITAPPFGMFSIVKYLKKKSNGINIIMDYRDPWNLWSRQSKYIWNLEKRYIQLADFITCTNTNIARDLSLNFNVDANKIHVVSNGYSEKVWADSIPNYNPNRDYMRISYIGSITLSASSESGFRDTSQLFSAFDKCIEEGMNIHLNFVGVDIYGSDYCIALKEKYDDKLEFSEMVDVRKSHTYMLESDVLLLLHTVHDSSSRYLVSGKLYDYIRANKTIFSIGSYDGLHAEIIEKEHLGYHCENNKNEIYEVISKIYKQWKTGILVPPNVNVRKYSREEQNKEYFHILR